MKVREMKGKVIGGGVGWEMDRRFELDCETAVYRRKCMGHAACYDEEGTPLSFVVSKMCP
jgi:hypothetical protein